LIEPLSVYRIFLILLVLGFALLLAAVPAEAPPALASDVGDRQRPDLTPLSAGAGNFREIFDPGMEDDILAPFCMKLPPADDLMELLEAAAGFAPVGFFVFIDFLKLFLLAS